jgi:hypothetical protein
MKARFQKYEQARDFMRVRDMLVETYTGFEKPVNWRLERWNYARYFAAPFLGIYGLGSEPVTGLKDTNDYSKKAIKLWEESVGIWENETGRVVGVVCPDEHVPWHPAFGQVHIQRHPNFTHLLPEMLDYGEKAFAHRGIFRTRIYEHDHDLLAVVKQRGYEKDMTYQECDSEYVIEELPESFLSDRFRFQSMADENNIDKRRKIFGIAFRHPDSREWPTVFSYEELQKAPDYRKDLDLYIVGPDGEYVSCCIVWFDEKNKIAALEPVGSIVLGMGREVVMEGIRRAAVLGAQSVWVGSGQRFYTAIGFKKKYVSYRWTKKL